MLIKKIDGVARNSQLSSALTCPTGASVDRRAFLKGSGLLAGGLAAASALKWKSVV